MFEVIDTFPAFLNFWEKAQRLSIEKQLEGWEKEYLKPYPELLTKQIDSYLEDNLDWRKIALKKVFPYLNKRLPAMQEAHDNLLLAARPLSDQVAEFLNFHHDVTVIIYIGVGVGAGWATTYQNKPAILFGLENIAECGWSSRAAIEGLFAHEVGHLVHYYWRGSKPEYASKNPWERLNDEGFAQRCEELITGTAFHQIKSNMGNDWLKWCQSHKSWLAAEFLKTTAQNKPVNRFFGSWQKIKGKSETGYYLGYEAIMELERKHSLQEIALFPTPEDYLKPILERFL